MCSQYEKKLGSDPSPSLTPHDFFAEAALVTLSRRSGPSWERAFPLLGSSRHGWASMRVNCSTAMAIGRAGRTPWERQLLVVPSAGGLVEQTVEQQYHARRDSRHVH